MLTAANPENRPDGVSSVQSPSAPRTVRHMTRMSALAARWCADGGRRLARMTLAAVVLVVVGLVAPAPAGRGEVAACDELWIPSINLTRCVVEGGQPQIDAGNVVRYTVLSSPTVHWLAGHRSSHGSTFATLTSIRIGAVVHYRGKVYIVNDYRLANRFQPEAVSDWIYSTQSSLALQTSAASPYVHVWHAVELVVAAPMVETAPPPVPGQAIPVP